MGVPYFSSKVIAALELVTALGIEDGHGRLKMCDAGIWMGKGERYAEDMLHALKRAGIVVGVPGRYHSGYQLASPPKSITVKRILDAIRIYDEAKPIAVKCSGTALGDAVVKPYIEDLMAQWLADLKEKTIADLVADAIRSGIDEIIFS